MDSREAKIVAGFLVADFEREMATTMRVLAAVPEARLDYRPDLKSKTALGLVRHICLEDEWLLDGVASGTFPPQPDDSDLCGIMTPAEAIARYQRTIPAALERVRALTGEALTRTLDLRGIVQAPALNLLASALKHSVHHRGQLSSYLRAMGGSVPSIYGPTADTGERQQSLARA
jgi:uncharacterized damage-inducible protein DinB